MLVVDKRYKCLKWRYVYFVKERQPSLEQGADIVQYELQNGTTGLTLVTDLTLDEEDLFDKIGKHSRKAIKCAQKEEVSIRYFDYRLSELELNEIIDFYNLFVDTKTELKFHFTKQYVAPYIKSKSFYCIAAFDNKNKRIAEAMYIGDGKTIRSWVSGSLFRRENESKRKRYLGNANRLLKWSALLYFKRKGYTTYDWGGIFRGKR